MPRIRIQRLESELFKLISNVVTFQLRNKNLQMVTIKAVRLANDLSYAKVFFSTLNEGKKDIVLADLRKSKGFIKRQIAAAQLMRIVPDLTFEYDEMEEKARKLDDIFAQIHSEEVESDDDK
ncbi:MAG: 30S ribosome-binding factor RbfA [Candidatus Cloacimonadales bacterium]|nr:30S ribosome-binding factor RbfA [Candidatus Cloacimonadales bacterium]